MKFNIRSNEGFTLLEVITVLAVLGIMAVLVVNRATRFDAEVYTGADALKSHIRYAQTVAMNANEGAGITYDSGGNQYWMYRGTETTNIMLLPDDAQFATADRKIDLDAKKITFNQNFTVYFDNRGIPHAPNSTTKMAHPLSIQVSAKSGGNLQSVMIHPLTGYVP